MTYLGEQVFLCVAVAHKAKLSTLTKKVVFKMSLKPRKTSSELYDPIDDSHEGGKGSARDREVLPGNWKAAVEARGIEEEDGDRHGEAVAPRRHAEDALGAAEASTVGHHCNHSAAGGNLAEARCTQGRA